MGHEINYLECRDTAESRKSLIMDAIEMAEENGDGWAGNQIRWLAVEPFACYEDAKKYIQEHDNGWYDQIAVRYRAPYNTKALEDARLAYRKANTKMRDYIRDSKPAKTRTSDYMTCKCCGSKLSVKHLGERHRCPLCETDLRSQTVIKKIVSMDKKIEDLKHKILEEERKASKRGEILWLVKIEYHI